MYQQISNQNNGGFTMEVKVKKCHKDAKMPRYADLWASGADLYLVEDIILSPGETGLAPTGLQMEIPPGWEIQIRPRSGMSFKTPIRVANAPGTIDNNYRGEIKVILTNTGDAGIKILKGERIAQAVLAPVYRAEYIEVEELSETNRGANGFGSTGI
jgi:dUTP pyrophosphatase